MHGRSGQQRRRACVRALLLASVLWLCASPAAGAPNIFDEDWHPPTPPVAPQAEKPPVQPSPAAPATSPARPTTTAPATPAPPSQPQTPAASPKSVPVPPAAARSPVPGSEERDASRKLMREIFARELADRSSPARRALARRLLDEADKATDKPADRYVLLGGAFEAAKESGNLPICVEAAKSMTSAFAVDSLSLLGEAAEKTLPNTPPAEAQENTRVALAILDDLAEAGDLARCDRIGLALRQSIRDPSAKTAIQEKLKDYDEVRAATAQASKDHQAFLKSPQDPALCLALGRYYCFYRDRWDYGLPLLAKGTAGPLALAAKADLQKPMDSEAQSQVGEAWLKAASTEPRRAKTSAQSRALTWFRRALPGATGLGHAALQRRVWELSRAIVNPKFTTYRYVDEVSPYLYALTDTTAPDELTVTAKPNEIRFGGVKKTATATIKGKMAGHFGKALMLPALESGGTLEVGVPPADGQTSYSIVLQEEGKKPQHTKLKGLERGVTYMWSAGERENEFVLEVRSKDAVVATLTTPKGPGVSFGWAATCRHAGEKADLVIKIE